MDSLGWECKISSFLHTKTFWINLKVFISSHYFLCHAKPWFCTKLSTNSHRFSIPTATKITCSFSFKRPFAASSTHRNFDFLQKPDYASAVKSPFRTGSKHGRAYYGTNKFLQKILMRWTFQISSKIPPHGFWTVPRESGGSQPSRLLFGSFCRSKKNVKRLFWKLFEKRKASQKCHFGYFRKSNTAPQPPFLLFSKNAKAARRV